MAKSRASKKARDWEDLGLYRTGSRKRSVEALQLAAGTLGPFPWHSRRRTRWSYEPFSGYPAILDVENAKDVCFEVAADYQRLLREEALSLRPSNMLSRLDDLAASSADLAKKLNCLSSTEREYLSRSPEFDGFGPLQYASAQRKQHGKKNDISESKRSLMNLLPQSNSSDGKRLDGGVLAENLKALSEHIVSNMNDLIEEFPFLSAPDRGGNTSVYSLFNASPAWQLVHQSWCLFSASTHLAPSATADGPLHVFIGAIHEYATGHDVSGTSRFETPLKQYAKLRRAHDDAIDELKLILMRTRGILFPSFHYMLRKSALLSALGGTKKLARALELADKVNALREELLYGPQNMARLNRRTSED